MALAHTLLRTSLLPLVTRVTIGVITQSQVTMCVTLSVTPLMSASSSPHPCLSHYITLTQEYRVILGQAHMLIV